MFLLYNILQLIFLPIFAPLLFIIALATPKYRGRMANRLGFGMKKNISASLPNQKTFWIHALSVGEVTSAVPLIQGLRKKHPSSRIIFTVSTRSGEAIARSLLKEFVDHIIPSPLDFLPVIALFFRRIQPQLFILIETDFWPNLLLYLHHKKIPAVLVNGRVSEKSMTGYRRYAFFFRPMFHSFRYLFMQTELDRQNMINLGIEGDKIKVLGNLKFDTHVAEEQFLPSSLSRLLPDNTIVITAGSTHQGEEDILFTAIKKLQNTYPQITLVLAPRDPGRADQICIMARQHDLTIMLRSENSTTRSDILLVDTIGELIFFYALADIAFIGGSLVDEGGHNPIEPAMQGIPVLFGPYMQDFHEIAVSLMKAGGAEQVTDSQTLQHAIEPLLLSEELRNKRGNEAKHCVSLQRGVIEKHLEILQLLL